MQAGPIASPSPMVPSLPASMQFAPPPMPPSFPRVPMGSVTELAPSMAGRATLVRQEKTISVHLAAVGVFVALVLGFVLGFVVHAAVSSPVEAEVQEQGAGKKK